MALFQISFRCCYPFSSVRNLLYIVSEMAMDNSSTHPLASLYKTLALSIVDIFQLPLFSLNSRLLFCTTRFAKCHVYKRDRANIYNTLCVIASYRYIHTLMNQYNC